MVLVGRSPAVGARAQLGARRLTKLAEHWLTRITGASSITFTSDVAAYRPVPGGALTVNGVLESMVRALTLELAPVRVKAGRTPGWVDTAV